MFPRKRNKEQVLNFPGKALRDGLHCSPRHTECPSHTFAPRQGPLHHRNSGPCTFVSSFDECISLSLAYNLPEIGILLIFAPLCISGTCTMGFSTLCCRNELVNELDPVERHEEMIPRAFPCLSVLTWGWAWALSVLPGGCSLPRIQPFSSSHAQGFCFHCGLHGVWGPGTPSHYYPRPLPNPPTPLSRILTARLTSLQDKLPP